MESRVDLTDSMEKRHCQTLGERERESDMHLSRREAYIKRQRSAASAAASVRR